MQFAGDLKKRKQTKQIVTHISHFPYTPRVPISKGFAGNNKENFFFLYPVISIFNKSNSFPEGDSWYSFNQGTPIGDLGPGGEFNGKTTSKNYSSSNYGLSTRFPPISFSFPIFPLIPWESEKIKKKRKKEGFLRF